MMEALWKSLILLLALSLYQVGSAQDIVLDDVAERGAPLGIATRLNLCAYDTEGNVGVVYASNFSVYRPGVFSSAWGFEDGTTGSRDGRLDPIGTNLPATDVPYWWESTNPWTGTWRGWSKTNTGYAYGDWYVVPLPVGRVGVKLDLYSNRLDEFDLVIQTSLADSLTLCSPLAYNYMPFSGRRSIVSAIYLPGNALYETLGSETHLFGPQDPLDAGQLGATWGNYLPSSSPSGADFSHTIPTGQMLAVVDYEGTTASATELVGIAGKYYRLSTLCIPLPGSDIPSARELLELPTAPEWILISSLDRVLTSPVRLATNLQQDCDRNGDGILDAGDYTSE